MKEGNDLYLVAGGNKPKINVYKLKYFALSTLNGYHILFTLNDKSVIRWSFGSFERADTYYKYIRRMIEAINI